jgi:dTDP-4-amino-4,6-dideoxygalactose transaminase
MTNTLNAINPTVLTQCFDWPPVGQRAIANVSRYLTEKRPLSIDGESGITEKLEQQLKLYFSCKYALLFNSGTSALHAAYFSINIPRGSAIAAPVYTYPATVMPMLGLAWIIREA